MLSEGNPCAGAADRYAGVNLKINLFISFFGAVFSDSGVGLHFLFKKLNKEVDVCVHQVIVYFLFKMSPQY